MHFDVVLSEFIHPCSKKRRGQFSIRAELTWLSECVRFRCVCMRARFRLASYMLALCLRAVLISSPDTWDWTRMHALVVMHRRTLYENVDSAKVKVPFYTTYIDIKPVASMHRIVIHCIDKYRSISVNRYTPRFKDVSYGNKTKTLKILFAVRATLNAMTMNVRFSALM